MGTNDLKRRATGRFARCESAQGGGGERRAAAVPHSKWGRHCCRPHSHRRVDVLTLRDLRRTFDPASVSACFRARCLASRCPVLRLALPEICHRRSRRHPALTPARFCVHRLTEVRAFSPPCTFAPAEAAFLYRCCRAAAGGFRRFRCVPAWPGSWPVRCHRLPRPSQRADLPSAKASCTSSLDERVTNVTAIFGIESFGISGPCGLSFPSLRVPKTSRKCA